MIQEHKSNSGADTAETCHSGIIELNVIMGRRDEKE